MRRLAYVIVVAVGLGLGVFWLVGLPLIPVNTTDSPPTTLFNTQDTDPLPVWVNITYSQCDGHPPWRYYHQEEETPNPDNPFEPSAYLTKELNPLKYTTQKYLENYGIFLYDAVGKDVDYLTCEGCGCPGYIYSFLVAESDAGAVEGLAAEIKCTDYDTCLSLVPKP